MKKNIFLLLVAIVSSVIHGMDNNLGIDWENTQDIVNDLNIDWENNSNIINTSIINNKAEDLTLLNNQSNNNNNNNNKRKKAQEYNKENKKSKTNNNNLTFLCNKDTCTQNFFLKINYRPSLNQTVHAFAIKIMKHTISHEKEYKNIEKIIENGKSQKKSPFTAPCYLCDTVISAQQKKHLKNQFLNHITVKHRTEELEVIKKEIEKQNKDGIEEYEKEKTSKAPKEKLIFSCDNDRCKQTFYSTITSYINLDDAINKFALTITAHKITSHQKEYNTQLINHIKEKSTQKNSLPCLECTTLVSATQKKYLKQQLLNHIIMHHQKEEFDVIKNKIRSKNNKIIKKYKKTL